MLVLSNKNDIALSFDIRYRLYDFQYWHARDFEEIKYMLI